MVIKIKSFECGEIEKIQKLIAEKYEIDNLEINDNCGAKYSQKSWIANIKEKTI